MAILRTSLGWAISLHLAQKVKKVEQCNTVGMIQAGKLGHDLLLRTTSFGYWTQTPLGSCSSCRWCSSCGSIGLLTRLWCGWFWASDVWSKVATTKWLNLLIKVPLQFDVQPFWENLVWVVCSIRLLTLRIWMLCLGDWEYLQTKQIQGIHDWSGKCDRM